MQKHKVLVTGATGYIANQLLPVLKENCALTLMDIKNHDPPGKKVSDVHIADLSDPEFEKYKQYFKEIDTVVHLGYYRDPGKEADDYRKRTYHDERLNVDMAYHVHKLSHDNGVRRIVVASSNHAADWYEPLIHNKMMDTVHSDMPPYSDNFYGWAKVAYEQLGFIFATGYFGRQLQNIQLRIGAPREINYRDFPYNPKGYIRDLGAYISQRDLQQLFIKSIEAENIENKYGIPFQIFYGISDNTRKFWNIVNARKTINYIPKDDSEVKFAKDIAGFLTGPGNN